MVSSLCTLIISIVMPGLTRHPGNRALLDSKGLVTVGVGHMIATATDAQQLAFTVNKTAKDATAHEIQTEYDNIKKQPKNRLAIVYKQFTTLSLANAAIDKLTDDHIRGNQPAGYLAHV